jgi:hypothetical protein
VECRRAPDGTIWKVATSGRKDTGPGTWQTGDIVLLLGVADVAASKRFYASRGLAGSPADITVRSARCTVAHMSLG